MPPKRFALIIISVIAAAGLTVWAGTAIVGNTGMSSTAGIAVLGVAALIAAVVVRQFAGGISDKHTDSHDTAEK